MQEVKFIVELKRVENKSVKAFVDVTVCMPDGEITLKGFRVVHQSDKQPWVAFPETSYQKDGETKSKKIVEVTRGLNKKICDLILEEYARLSRS